MKRWCFWVFYYETHSFKSWLPLKSDCEQNLLSKKAENHFLCFWSKEPKMKIQWTLTSKSLLSSHESLHLWIPQFFFLQKRIALMQQLHAQLRRMRHHFSQERRGQTSIALLGYGTQTSLAVNGKDDFGLWAQLFENGCIEHRLISDLKYHVIMVCAIYFIMLSCFCGIKEIIQKYCKDHQRVRHHHLYTGKHCLTSFRVTQMGTLSLPGTTSVSSSATSKWPPVLSTTHFGIRVFISAARVASMMASMRLPA